MVMEAHRFINDIPIEEILDGTKLDIKVVLKGLLNGITDIIGVYKPDGEIIFFNNAGYEFLNISPGEAVGKKCYEMLGRSQRCQHCMTEAVMDTKKPTRLEKYVPELDKFMDYCCNPVMDREGKIILVIEQMRDITEKVKFEAVLRESEEKYRSMVELSPYGIVVLVDGKIALANNEAVKMYGKTEGDLVGKGVSELVSPEFRNIVVERMGRILKEKLEKSIFEYKIINSNKEILEISAISSYLTYKGRPAIQCVIRDITKMRSGLNNAGILQRQSLPRIFPIPEKAFMEGVYIPAGAVSGDFYCISRLDENTVVGAIFDVSGKGFTAALNVSGFNVLFNEAIILHKSPADIIYYLNKKASGYLRESYVAACCFSFDFKSRTASIVGAGINRLMLKASDRDFEEVIVKGPFIGMFEDSEFEEKSISFGPGDKFYFFTDGFDNLFDDEEFLRYASKIDSISDFKRFVSDWIEDKPVESEAYKDDSTLLAVQIK